MIHLDGIQIVRNLPTRTSYEAPKVFDRYEVEGEAQFQPVEPVFNANRFADQSDLFLRASKDDPLIGRTIDKDEPLDINALGKKKTCESLLKRYETIRRASPLNGFARRSFVDELNKALQKKLVEFSPDEKKKWLRVAFEYAVHSELHTPYFLHLVNALARSLDFSWVDVLQNRLDLLARFDLDLIDFVRSSKAVPFDVYFKQAMFGGGGAYVVADPDELISSSAKSCFSTLSEHSDFGKLIAYKLFDLWLMFGCPDDFHVVEMGAGKGTLAINIFKFIDASSRYDYGWSEFKNSLRYSIVEISPTLARYQWNKLRFNGYNVEIINQSAIDGKMPDIKNGAFISNELVDMFPPKKVIWLNGKLYEIHVVERSNFLSEVLGPCSREAAEYVEKHELNLEDGKYLYIRPNIDRWAANLLPRLQNGYNMIIDYGSRSEKQNFSDPLNFRCYHRSRDVGMSWFFDLLEGIGVEGRMWMQRAVHSPCFLYGMRDMTVDVDAVLMGESASRLGAKVATLSYEAFADGVLSEMGLHRHEFSDSALYFCGGFVQFWSKVNR